MKFFSNTKKDRVLKAVLPNSREFESGILDATSLTWAFIRKWATKELNLARIANDSLSKDEQQTAALRGRIRVLIELLSLPETPAKREKPQLELNDDSSFAGY